MPTTARTYINVVIAAGLAIVAYGAFHWDSQKPIQLLLFFALFAGAALLKVRIPGVTGTYSPVFFLVLIGSSVLSFPGVVLAAGLAGIVQCTLLVRRYPSLLQVCFNAANMMISAASAFVLIHPELLVTGAPALAEQPLLIRLILAASVYYLVNTGLVSIVLTLVESKPLNQVWRHWCLGSLPYYVFGALIAGATLSAQRQVSFWMLAMVCPSILLATVYHRYWLRSGTRLNALVQ
jgi:hypothetical protein